MEGRSMMLNPRPPSPVPFSESSVEQQQSLDWHRREAAEGMDSPRRAVPCLHSHAPRPLQVS